MPTFIAVHKWKPEDYLAISKETIGAFIAMESGKLPEGIKLHTTYSTVNGAFCVWEAPSKEALEKWFEKNGPIMKKYTEFVPVVQAYPPTMEYVIVLGQQMLKAASK